MTKGTYKDKLLHVVRLVVRCYNNIGVSSKLIYIDGGELTGTSTLIKNIIQRASNNESIVFTKEPTPEAKAKILATYGDESLITDPSEIIAGITEMFMLDRKANQNKWGDKLIVSDRGIFSTFVYQSGILDPETEVEDIIANCETIYNSMVKNEILLPVVAINLCSVDNNYKADSDEFQRRLRKRVENKEQELDALDDVTHAMTINRIYSDITRHAQKYVEPGRLFAVDFRLPEELSLAKVTAIFDECIMGVKSTDVDESEIPNIEDGINVV